jgi:hypothetical protein
VLSCAATDSRKLSLCSAVNAAGVRNPINTIDALTTDTGKHAVAPAASLRVSVSQPSAGQAAHLTSGEFEYIPRAHAVHTLPPAAASVFVVEPGLQVRQAASVDAAANMPGAQFRQSVAPVEAPLFVIAPGGQTEQWPCVEGAEYFPAVHVKQVVPPARGPASVTVPGGHSVQADSFDCRAYHPSAHAVHALAPGELALFVIEPVPQRVQDEVSDRGE